MSPYRDFSPKHWVGRLLCPEMESVDGYLSKLSYGTSTGHTTIDTIDPAFSILLESTERDFGSCFSSLCCLINTVMKLF